jgi:hypothetical protein
MLVFRWKQNTKFPWLALRTKKKNTTMAPRKAKKEQAALRRAALENKAAAQRATSLQEVSLSGQVLKDVDESMSNKLLEVAADALTTDDDEKSSQSKKTSGKSGASKRKSSASASSSKASTPTKHRKLLSKHAKKRKARAETDAETCSEHSDSELSDQDDVKGKPAAGARTSPRKLLLPAVLVASIENDGSDGEDLEEQPPLQEAVAQSPAELRAVLIKTKERLVRAEHQVRAISKTRIADTFLEGQVRTWTKETLWKMCRFITNDQTMHQEVMQKASKHFKIPALDQEHWMLFFAHIVREGLNQKRNACSQDLRKGSKVSAVSYICFAKNLSNILLSKQWYRESSSISGSVSSTPKFYQCPRHGPGW